MFRTVPLYIIRSFSLYTQQWYMSYRFADCLLASSQQYMYDICLLLYVESSTPDDGRKDRPKHVECYTYLLTYSMVQSPS